MIVEETLATPSSFRFTGRALASIEELPASGPWPSDLSQTRLIQVEQPINFNFEWQVSGPLVPLLDRNFRWKIQVYFEKWGASETAVAPSITVPYQAVSGFTYRSTINLPANTLREGVYDVVAVLRLYDGSGRPLPVAGFEEMGKFEVYEQA
ncbi:MAG: hypothetical protein LCH81_03845 [Bacteroidetes bacterium]|nr:hypothetical protein [Bacteroidota bacterium]